MNAKPIWSSEQVKTVEKYLQSKEWADKLNEFNKKWEAKELKEKQEQIEWWNEIKDIPFI